MATHPSNGRYPPKSGNRHVPPSQYAVPRLGWLWQKVAMRPEVQLPGEKDQSWLFLTLTNFWSSITHLFIFYCRCCSRFLQMCRALRRFARPSGLSNFPWDASATRRRCPRTQIRSLKPAIVTSSPLVKCLLLLVMQALVIRKYFQESDCPNIIIIQRFYTQICQIKMIIKKRFERVFG